jgi:hypothetical protein
MTIPDYKVEAALAVMFKNTIEEILTDQQAKDLRDRVRRGLEAAEAAQEQPQIEVTEEMWVAGRQAAEAAMWKALILEPRPLPLDVATAIYRAMRALEKKPEPRYRSIDIPKLPWFGRMNKPSSVIPLTDPRSGKDRRDPYGLCLRKSKRRKTQGDER